MRSYDEITSQVLEKAAVKAVKIKRIRYSCTLTAICAACAIGGSAFLKLDKPEIQPDYPTDSQSDSFYSASDPSADMTDVTTEPVTETTAATTTTEAATTAPATSMEEIVTTAVTIPADIVTIYVEPVPAPINTSIPGETHTTAVTTRHTTTPHKSESTETTTVVTVVTEAPTGTEAPHTETETELVTETEAVQTAASETQTEPAATEELMTETEPVTEPETTEPATEEPTEENWQLLYDMYINGELPFTFDVMQDLKALEALQAETEETVISLFPDYTE